MQFSLLKLPKSFEKALERWRSAQVASIGARQQLLVEMQKIADENTNVYLVDLRPASVDKFGFTVAQSAFDLGTEIVPDDVLGSDPDKKYLETDVFPNYLHVAESGELNVATMKSHMSEILAHYDRLILPLNLSMNARPEFAISLSRLRLRTHPENATGQELSPRELSILSAAAQGMTIKQTARELNSSPRTIETHVSSIRQKLGANNLTHAVALYLLMSSF